MEGGWHAQTHVHSQIDKQLVRSKGKERHMEKECNTSSRKEQGWYAYPSY